jgi:hypothetical protein
MTALFDNHNSISEGIQKLAHGESMPWTELSVLLDQVDKTGYWEETANSFTDWLKSNAEKLGNKESTLWRYLVVGRYYHDLRKQFARVKLEYPPLLKLPKHVSPEKLELLSKLGRVAPKDFFEKLIYDVLDNAITRDDIREQWKAFRPALKGKTARGRRVLRPMVNLKNKDEFSSVREALIINALKAYGSNWLGKPKAKMYEVKMHVKLDPGLSRNVLDAVILYKQDNKTDLEVHIIETMPSFLFRKNDGSKFDFLSKHCDYLWIAVSNDPKDMISKSLLKSNYPDYVGILTIDNSDISVVRKAKPCEKDYVKANELLKVLLLKESR